LTSSVAWSIVCLEASIGFGPMCAPRVRSRQTEHTRRISEEQIFAELAEQNRTRSSALFEYVATRVHRVGDPSGKTHAQEASAVLR